MGSKVKGHVIGSSVVSLDSARRAESNDVWVSGVWSPEMVRPRIVYSYQI